MLAPLQPHKRDRLPRVRLWLPGANDGCPVIALAVQRSETGLGTVANEDQIFHNRRLLSLYTYLSRSLCLC